MYDIKIGADPEVWVSKGGVYQSAYGLIPGTKEAPYPVDNGAVQVDGMALEFNINPADTEEEFVHNIQTVMSTLRSMVPDYEVVVSPVADFNAEYLGGQPPEATDLGCDPDFNAYTGRQNQVPNAKSLFRTGAGHLHIGWTEGADPFSEQHDHLARSLVRELDYTLGLPSVLFDRDNKRRELYGKAGAYRPKPYGVEYRVLSNMWLSSPELIAFVYRGARDALDRLMSGNSLQKRSWQLPSVINNGDIHWAKDICDVEGIAYAL